MSIVLALIAIAGNPVGRAAGDSAPATALARHVVDSRDVDQVATAEAVVEAVRQSTVAAQVQGRVVELGVRAGDRVRAGQVIARIDPRSADQALLGSRAQVAEAKANLASATQRFERSRQLLAQKFVSQAAFDQAEAEYRAALAQLSAMEAGAGQAATAQTFTAVTAPYAAVVAATHLDVGDMASPGRAIATVFEPGLLRVTATLSQTAFAAWRRGEAVQVEIPSSRIRVAASAVTVLPVADSRSHTTKVRLDLPAMEGVLPGQFARAAFVTGRARKLVVPGQAVLRRSEVTAVYVLDPAHAAPQLRQIRVGEPLAGGLVEVLAGLRAGESIAVDPVRAGLHTDLAPARKN